MSANYPLADTRYWDDYFWLVVVGGLVSFLMAWTIGCNDLANSFGNVVGAKTLPMWQACVLASICEFVGAVSLGGEVTRTVAGSIARPTAFLQEPELFAYGMVCALTASAMWVFLATYLSLAVSTTHASIGAVMGFALVWQGRKSVVWGDPAPSFPYARGLVPIVVSWFVSPIAAGIVSAFLFFYNRGLVLRHKNAKLRAFLAFSPLVVLTVFINSFFVLFKGAKNQLDWDSNLSAWVAAAMAGGCGLLAAAVVALLLNTRSRREGVYVKDSVAEMAKPGDHKNEGDPDMEAAQQCCCSRKLPKWIRAVIKVLLHGVTQDVFQTVEKNESVLKMHEAAEVFDPEAEKLYRYLHIFSACAVAFTHGSNDVANAVGPFAAIYYVYTNYRVISNAKTPFWMLIMGGSGLALGCVTYGYNIVSVIGVQLASMTPARGFCAELATSFTLAVASVYGLPVSTTHTVVGADVGIGITESFWTGVNWRLLGKTAAGWVATLVVAASLSAALFAQGAYAPSIFCATDRQEYADGIRELTNAIHELLNSSNMHLAEAFQRFNTTLNDSIAFEAASIERIFNASLKGYIDPTELLAFVKEAFHHYLNNTVVTVGYKTSAAIKAADEVYVPAADP